MSADLLSGLGDRASTGNGRRPADHEGSGARPRRTGRAYVPLAQLRGLALAACWGLVVLSCSGLTAQWLFDEPSAVKYLATVMASFLVALGVAMNQPLFCVACLMVVVAPTAPFAATFFGIQLKPVFLLMGIAALFLMLGTGRRLGRSTTSRMLPMAGLLMFVPFGISSHPWKTLGIFATGALVSWVVARVVVTEGPWRLTAVLVATCVMQGLIAIYQYQSGNAFDIYSGSAVSRGSYFFSYDGVNRSTGTFFDPIALANVLAASLPVALALLIRAVSGRRFWWAVASAGAMVVIAGGLVTTLSRMSWVGAAAGLLVCVLLLPRKAMLWSAGGLAVSGLLGVQFAAQLGGPQLALRIGSIMHPTGVGVATAGGDEVRKQMWAFALKTWREHPITGIGMGDLPYAFQRDVIGSSLSTHAHSVYFHLAAEGGLLVLTAFGLLALAWFRDVIGAIRSERLVVPGLIGAMTCFAVASLTDVTVLLNQSVMTIFAVIVGVGLGVVAQARSRAEPTRVSVVVLP